MKKTHKIIAIASVILSVSFGYRYFRTSSASLEKFQQIRTGMTLAEVQGVMADSGTEQKSEAFNERVIFWNLYHNSSNAHVRTTFRDGHVIKKDYWESPSVP